MQSALVAPQGDQFHIVLRLFFSFVALEDVERQHFKHILVIEVI